MKQEQGEEHMTYVIYSVYIYYVFIWGSMYQHRTTLKNNLLVVVFDVKEDLV